LAGTALQLSNVGRKLAFPVAAVLDQQWWHDERLMSLVLSDFSISQAAQL